jgi:hypothetical protein
MRFIHSLPMLTLLFLGTTLISSSCSKEEKKNKEEQIAAPDLSALETGSDSALASSVQGNMAISQIASTPNAVILTGMPEHRLVTVYKDKPAGNGSNDRNWFYKGAYDDDVSSQEEHFMPGIDILYGYNLLNIAHYDLTSGKLNFMFKHSALIKTLYYPSFEQDSLHKKAVNRNFYLVSVYDEDTNKDTLINRKDLRRFYLFDSSSTVKTQLIPADYSVIRSQYDSQNDVMYLYASHDANKNGTRDKKEPVHIFWFNLVAPQKAKRLY